MYRYYNSSGVHSSDHIKPEVGLKKAQKSGGLVLDYDDFDVAVVEGKVTVLTKPGGWYSVFCRDALSNSAYHRCGSGTSWRGFWIERRVKSVGVGVEADEPEIETVFHDIKIPSVRADKIFEQQVKVPSGVDTIYLACGRQDRFASVNAKLKGSADYNCTKIVLGEADLLIPEWSEAWDGTPRVYDYKLFKVAA